jgi:hypothetical protein
MKICLSSALCNRLSQYTLELPAALMPQRNLFICRKGWLGHAEFA